MTHPVLTETLWPAPQGAAGAWARRAALVLAGVAALILAAQVRVPMWPSPVPVTMSTFAVLMLGVAYGPRLGFATLAIWLALGAAGFDVFADSDATSGLAYMLGGTGGYLLGFALAGVVAGLLARAGWDRSMLGMAAAMLIGNLVIYAPGLLWLRGFAADWGQTLAWGLWPYLIGDGLKLALATLLAPGLWRAVRAFRG
ncbi:MAG: biotin transporter BioY [Pseudomonadota bacterium]